MYLQFCWIMFNFFLNLSPSGLDSLCAPFLYLNFNNEGKPIYHLNNYCVYCSKIFYSNMKACSLPSRACKFL